MKHLKKVLLAAGCALTLSMNMAAAEEKTKLRWLDWNSGNWGEQVIDDLITEFEASHQNIDIEYVPTPWSNMYDVLVANAQGGQNQFDVMSMEACCFLSGIDKLGGIAPLSDYLEKDPEFAKTLTTLTPVKWNGETMMLNWYIFPYSYVYNIDMYEKAGVAPPKSWQDILDGVKKVKESGAAPQGLGVTFSAADMVFAIYYEFGSRLAQMGGRFVDDQGKAVFNSEEGVKALEWWKGVYDSEIASPGALGTSMQQLREDFALGKTAGLWDGPFVSATVKQINPDIRVAFAPPICDVTCGYQWAGSGLSISSKSEHKDEAWQFIKFLMSEAVTTKLTQSQQVPFATNAAIASLEGSTDPILSQIPGMLNKDPKNNLFLDPTADFEQMHRALIEAIQQYLSGKATAKEALDTAAAVWNEKAGIKN